MTLSSSRVRVVLGTLAAVPRSGLRDTVLRAAVAHIAEHGPDGLSLRQVAADAGVSHQAPYHHFGDRKAVFHEIGREGYVRLAAALERVGADPDPRERLLAMGEQYVRFALRHRGHFRVMFRSDLCPIAESADLLVAADGAFEVLRRQVAEVLGDTVDEQQVLLRAATMWSLAHGLATLLIDGSMESKVPRRGSRAQFVRSVLEGAVLSG